MLAMPCLVLACGTQEARLTGESLVISPCREGRPLEIAPVDLSFNHLVWVRNSDESATLEIRRGWRVSTESDEVVLQFTDLPAVREAFRLSPGVPIPLGAVARLTVALRSTCPDPRQALVADAGEFTLTRFELDPGGWIAGTARFDLADAREAPSSPPAGTDLTLTFSLALEDKDPLTGYGR